MKIAYIPSLYDKDIKDATNITLTQLSGRIKKHAEYVSIIAEREEGAKQHEIVQGVDVHKEYELPEYPQHFYQLHKYIAAFCKDILSHAIVLRKAIRKTKQKPDIIHGISSSPMMIIRTLLCKAVVPRAKTIHTIKGHTRYGLSNIATPLLNFSNAIIVPSNIMKKKLSKYGCSSKKIHIIHSPVDLEKFVPMKRSALHKKYRAKTIILYYGHMSEVKGISTLINAIDILRNEDVHFLFVTQSSKKFYAPYEERIKELRLGKKVAIIEKVAKIEEYVAQSDAVVLPYPELISTEGNPLCLLESMACKTPVVTTEIPELTELVEKSKDVLMAEPKNPESVAKELRRIIHDKQLRTKLANHAYPKVKKFDINTIVKQHEELYKKVLQQ